VAHGVHRKLALADLFVLLRDLHRFLAIGLFSRHPALFALQIAETSEPIFAARFFL
jgi:hypothetical protein